MRVDADPGCCPDDAACDDGIACTVDRCVDGGCEHDAAVCDDGGASMVDDAGSPGADAGAATADGGPTGTPDAGGGGTIETYGCGCRAAHPRTHAGWLALLPALALLRRRRRD